MVRRIALCLALAGLAVLGVQRLAVASSLDGMDWRQRVDATVLRSAAAGTTEFLVEMKAQADLSGAAALQTKEEKGRYVYRQLTATARATQPAVTRELDLLRVPYRSFWVVNALWVKGDLAVVELLARHPDVAYVHPTGYGRLSLPGGTEAQAGPEATAAVVGPVSNISKVRAPEAWALGVTGKGVVVAGADTGVYWKHEALLHKYRGWDGVSADHNYNWHDGIKTPNAFCPGSSREPCDDDALLGGGHGTHTVGTMVGSVGSNEQVGVAPDAQWIACRNMNNGLGAVPTYLDCMEWFMAPTDLDGNNPDPDRAPHVINNSWGCVEGCASPLLKAQIDASRAAGIVYVVSAGNDGSQCSSLAFPLAVYRSAFSVGATAIATDNIAGFSSRGPVLTNPLEGVLPKPDISAPGVGVRSALRNGGYGNLSGTSMAGPHVAGLVALVISANRCLAGKVDVIEDIIKKTAVPRTTTQGCGGDTSSQVPNNVYGWGRIDALAAVQAARDLNRAPVARDDAAVTRPETPVNLRVLANDTDPNGDALVVSAVTQGAAGEVSLNGDGTVTYVPRAGFTGMDRFSYTVEDCAGAASTATVSVTVEAPQVCRYVDDAHAALALERGWHHRSNAAASGGGYHRRVSGTSLGGPPASARLVFSGDEVTYHYLHSNAGGSATIFIDGVRRDSVGYGQKLPGPEQLTFGHRRTYAGLGPGTHELVIQAETGTVYIDGFSFNCQTSASADPSAAQHATVTELLQAAPSEGLFLQRTVTVGSADEHLSVVVDGTRAPATVRLLDLRGNVVAAGADLLEGSAYSGLDATPAPGTYVVQVIAPSGDLGEATLSIARTTRVR